MVKNGNVEDELEELGNGIEKLEETFSSWKRWKWYYIFFGATGKAAVILGTYMLMGLTANHFTGEEVRVENFIMVYVSPGGSTGPFSLDQISYTINLEDNVEELVRFRRFTNTRISYLDRDSKATPPLIRCKFEWEWFWILPVPKSIVLIRAKRKNILIK